VYCIWELRDPDNSWSDVMPFSDLTYVLLRAFCAFLVSFMHQEIAAE